jgi:hypothetical protein
MQIIIFSFILLNPSYNRGDWRHWIDEDGDCQNTRAEILIRDNTGMLKFKKSKFCLVTAGRWICPYTSNIYTRASDIDIDHIIPLAYAHRAGASGWSWAKKRQFANDPLNLLAVGDSINRKKGSKGVEKWMPPNKGFHKKYKKLWLLIRQKYKLTIQFFPNFFYFKIEGYL